MLPVAYSFCLCSHNRSELQRQRHCGRRKNKAHTITRSKRKPNDSPRNRAEKEIRALPVSVSRCARITRQTYDRGERLIEPYPLVTEHNLYSMICKLIFCDMRSRSGALVRNGRHNKMDGTLNTNNNDNNNLPTHM